MPVEKIILNLSDISEADKSRFLSHIIPPKNPGDCWEIGYKPKKSGHKSFRLNGRMVSCHYFSWRIFNPNAEDSVNLQICHNCNNPGCVNPAHIRLDTLKSNMIDMAMAGNTKGQKLSPENIREVRRLLTEGKLTQEQIGDRFGVSRATIGDIKSGKSWDHLENKEGIKLPEKGVKTTNKLNPEKVREIKRLLAEGKLIQKQIGEKFGVSVMTISDIKTGKTWSHVQ